MSFTHSHPYPDYGLNDSVEVLFPMAVELEITFSDNTEMEMDHDFIVFCKDAVCSEQWGNYSGTNFPGMNSSPNLLISASIVYFRFYAGVNVNNLWGYSFSVTPLYGMFSFP